MNRSNKKNKNKNRKPMRRPTLVNPDLILRRSDALQPIVQHVVPGNGFLLSPTSSTTMAYSVGMSAAQITNFTARFGVVYDEYRIVKVVMEIDCGATSTGICNMWFEPKSNVLPTAAKAQTNSVKVFSLQNVTDTHRVTYIPNDIAYLGYQATSGTSIIGYFNIYTDTTFGNTTVAPIVMGVVRQWYTVQFRGFV